LNLVLSYVIYLFLALRENVSSFSRQSCGVAAFLIRLVSTVFVAVAAPAVRQALIPVAQVLPVAAQTAHAAADFVRIVAAIVRAVASPILRYAALVLASELNARFSLGHAAEFVRLILTVWLSVAHNRQRQTFSRGDALELRLF